MHDEPGIRPKKCLKFMIPEMQIFPPDERHDSAARMPTRYLRYLAQNKHFGLCRISGHSGHVKEIGPTLSKASDIQSPTTPLFPLPRCKREA